MPRKISKCKISTCRKVFDDYASHKRRYCCKACADSPQGQRQRALRRALTKRRRGLKPYEAYSHEYKGHTLDSGWELLLAKRLDALGIRWTRGEHALPWTDQFDLPWNFHPDFYLPDYDMYLEVKGEHLMHLKEDEHCKQTFVMDNYEKVVFLRSKKACREFDVKEANKVIAAFHD